MSITKLTGVVAAVCVSSAPALAGPFVNIESRSSYIGNDRLSTVTDVHVGYEAALSEKVDLSVQAGPAFLAIEGEDGTTREYSGKAALSADVSDNLNLYGELSVITIDRSADEDLPIGLELGAKYSF